MFVIFQRDSSFLFPVLRPGPGIVSSAAAATHLLATSFFLFLASEILVNITAERKAL